MWTLCEQRQEMFYHWQNPSRTKLGQEMPNPPFFRRTSGADSAGGIWQVWHACGLVILSCCTPAVLGSHLAVGSFYLRNWRPLNLWGHLQYQAVEKTFALRVVSPFSLSSGPAFFLTFFMQLVSAPSCLSGCWRHCFAHRHKLRLCCVPLLPSFEKVKQRLREEHGEGRGRGR